MFSLEDTKKIKGWAILMMLMHHCFLSPERYEGKVVDFAPFTEEAINYAANAMKICVCIFVFLSAYGITVSYKKSVNGDYSNLSGKIVSRFVYRRCVKLWMSFLFIFILAQLYPIVAFHQNRFFHIYGEESDNIMFFILDMLGLAELFQTPTYLATFWYISLAWLIILAVPLFIAIYHKFGSGVLIGITFLISVFIPVTSEQTYAYFPDYGVTIAAGIICADKDLIVRTAEAKKIPKVLKLVIYLLLLTGLIACRQETRTTTLLCIWNGIIAYLTCVLFYEFINRCPLIREVLSLIGKYATTIFLTHNFIRVIWYYDFTYSFGRWWLILLVLLGLSLALAVVIDLLQRFSGYKKLTDKLVALYN